MEKLIINEIDGKEYTFLTNNSYSISKLTDEIKILSRSEYKNCIIESNIDNVEDLLPFLKNNIESGIYIIYQSNSILFFNSFLGTELAYYNTESNLYVSDSSLTIAEKFNFKLSKEAIATHLIAGLPYFPFNTISMWEGVKKIDVLTHLEVDKERGLSFIQDSIKQIDNLDENFEQKIKSEITKKIESDVLNYKKVTLDISGGIDSAVIAYILNSITKHYSAYHSNSNENSDTEWAKFISNDLKNKLIILESISKKNKRFDIKSDFLEGNIPDSPLLWSDTEGYITDLLEQSQLNKNDGQVHLIGIGGDDIFSPMPSAPWSIAREGSIGLKFLFNYSIHSKRNFILCLKSFNDKKSYFNDLTSKINECFSESYQEPEMLFPWNENILLPPWLSTDIKNILQVFLLNLADNHKDPVHSNKTKYQIIQSLIFQNSILSQLNIISPEKIHWSAPYLNSSVIENSLNLSDLKKYHPTILKPFLKEMMADTIPEELFDRGSKGDYSSTLYTSYREIIKKYNGCYDKFELVKLGIIDSEVLQQELSMPTANPNRIEFFEKVCSMERWLRQLKKNYEVLYEKNF